MQPDCLLVVLGDSPRLPSGLARIAGDITARLYDARVRLGIEVLQMGWEYGRPPLGRIPWPLITFHDIGQDWGASQVLPMVFESARNLQIDPRKVVLLSVWDPARCFEYRDAGCSTWGYFAVDGHNPHGSFGGPAAEAVQTYTRVLGYTEYGAQVLHNVRTADPECKDARISYLPHGHTWDRAARLEAVARCTPPVNRWRLGCVATNQPRKDLGLFCQVLRILLDRGEQVQGWLHTDDAVTAAWSLPELIEVYGLTPETCLITSGHTTEDWLQMMYASCAVTLAPGRGEGFGYPIVESYAMGRPVVHVDYAGGRELTLPEGRIPADWYTIDNPYCIQRPLLRPQQVANRCAELATLTLEDPARAAYYAGTVAHLHWNQLWPRWETWVRTGLRSLREQVNAQPPEAPVIDF
jgi:glycosyltransferase involved in cell wall biosynthesis